jgi:ATP-dependent helicase HrpB
LAAVLLGGVRTFGLPLLPWPSAAQQLRSRAGFASSLDPAIPPLDDASLLETAEAWLGPLLEGKRRLSDIEPAALTHSLRAILGHEAVRAVDRLAPAEFITPAGSSHPIDYSAPSGPVVEIRAQALFGLRSHPVIGGGKVPLTLAITSPAGRPIQTTKDLPGFWAGSWREVAREMRGRYPRHPWPDDPATAPATLRTKRADQRNQ